MMKGLLKGGLSGALTRYSDIALAALVIGIIGMMIIPLPTFLLDLLLTLNITISVMLLMVSLYIPSALKIAAFPSILLITTLFRLALNVSSTRLILLHADAGEVIAAFGNFVVQGNFVVGGVIFLILTLIQFLVIAKGAERVSEVGARFTLDAMPGKQMSIDADLRAGAFDLDEARRRRGLVEMESRLYGAMDGAMKFVKGDAIAGVIMTAINILAGIVIGVMQKGMPVGDAAQTYTLLTIGDGLVSQIPALLIATTAGIIVTRVASDEEATHLGSDIFGQLLAQPKALAITATLLLLFGLIPGLPTVPFLIMAAIMGAVAYGLFQGQAGPHDHLTEDEAREVEEVEEQAKEGARQARAMIPVAVPLTLEVGSGVTELMRQQERLDWLQEMIPTMREGIFYELGVKIPGLRVRTDARSCQPFEITISIDEIPVSSLNMPEGKILVAEKVEELALFGVEATEARHPATGQPVAWVGAEHQEQMEQAGYATWDAAGYVLLLLTATLREHAHEFVGIQDVQLMLDQLEGPYPAIVQEVVPKLIGLQALTDILRRLAKENISLRQLPKILETLAERAKNIKDPLDLTEEVRAGLCRYITHKYAGRQGQMVVYLIDNTIDELIKGSVRVESSGTYLTLDPRNITTIMNAVRTQVTLDLEAGRAPILLTSQESRRYLKRLVSSEMPEIVVLSFYEVDPAMRVQPLGRISI